MFLKRETHGLFVEPLTNSSSESENIDQRREVRICFEIRRVIRGPKGFCYFRNSYKEVEKVRNKRGILFSCVVP